MRKSPSLMLVTAFLVVLGTALSLLVLTRRPVAMTPTTVPCNGCQVAVVSPSPTPYEVPSQCAETGEAYELRVINFSAIASRYNLSPDGKFALIKENNTVYLKDISTGALEQIVQESDATGIGYRAVWSPDSHAVLFGSQNIRHPLVIPVNFNAAPIMLANADSYNFHGWSPNSQYVAVQNNNDPTGISVMDTRTNHSVYDIEQPHPVFGFTPLWSPDSQWMAYIDGYRPNPNTAWQYAVVLAGMGNTREYIFPLDSTPANRPSEANLAWSPDSQKVVLRYKVGGSDGPFTEHFDIFTIDNQRLPTMRWQIPTAPVPIFADDLIANGIDNMPMWDAGSEFLSDVRFLAENNYELVNYYPADGHTETPGTDLYKPALYAPVGSRIALYMQRNNRYDIELMDWNGENRIPMVEQAADANNLSWSPDGQWVAASWAINEGSSIILSWMRPDGSRRQDLQADFTEVRNLKWLPGDKLAYIAWRANSGNNLEIVDLNTGERSVVIAGLESLPSFDYDPDSDQLTFQWREQDGTFGLDGYKPDGTRTYRVLVNGEFERPFTTFWSPDGKMVILKIGSLAERGLYDEKVIIGYTDGRPSVTLRSGLDDLGNPLWSPDSRQFAFIQQTKLSLSLESFSPIGLRLYNTQVFQIGIPLEWSACS